MMRSLSLRFWIGICITLLLVAPVSAQEATPTPGRDPKLGQEIAARLAAINRDAVPLFEAATIAMDADNFEAAREGYLRVLELAPGFPDALRRLSYIEGYTGNVEAALKYARAAYDIDPSSFNKMALARALVATEDKDYAEEALRLAKEAAKELPDDADANLTLLYVAIAADDSAMIEVATQKLLVLVPSFPYVHYVAGLLAAQKGEWEKAEQELLLAQKLGMPAEDVQQALNDTGIAGQAALYRSLRWSAYAFVGWLIGFPVLFVAGSALSQITLAAVKRPQSATLEVKGLERFIRAVYGIVIAITSAYFYLSIPILIVAVLLLGGGILYLFFAIGRIPVQLLAVVILGTLYTLGAIVRSVFTRLPDSEPGRPLTRAESPRLWALAEEVAQKVDTRPVDAIYITPGTEIAVTERGSFWKKLRRTGQRCLIVGLGVLPEMTLAQFKAILAHEYGHFSNRDTAGGHLARQVRASIFHMAVGLARTGQAHWFNPAWLFVNGFYRIFLRITLGASRLQEILADRYAAIAYGARNFANGLTHVIRQGMIFDLQAGHEIERAVYERRVTYNLYNLPLIDPTVFHEKIRPQLEEALNRPTSPYDSHPAPRERIALVQALNARDVADPSGEFIADLLPDPEKLQTEMTAVVYKNVRARMGR